MKYVISVIMKNQQIKWLRSKDKWKQVLNKGGNKILNLTFGYKPFWNSSPKDICTLFPHKDSVPKNKEDGL